MPTTIENVAKLGRKTLLQAVKLYEDGSLDLLADKMSLNTVTTQQQYEEIAAYAGIGMAGVVPEMTPPPTASYEQIYSATLKPIKLMLQVVFSHEALADEQKAYNVLNSYGQDLREGFDQTEEVYAANVFMNWSADGTNYPGPDGIALGGIHVVENGTYNNYPATAGPISPDTFNDMLIILSRQPAHMANMLMAYRGQVVIECAPEQEMAALELQKSLDRPDTGDRATNVLRSKIAEVVVNPWFTNTLWWCVRGVNKRRCRRLKLDRERYNLVQFRYDDSDDGYIATSRRRVYYGTMDWRDVAYNYAS